MTNKIKETRKKQGFTQEDLSIEIGVTQTRMSNIENGKVKVTQEEWDELSITLDRTVAFLKSSISDWSSVDKEIGEGRALLYEELKDSIDDISIHNEAMNEETYLACQQIIKNPMLLDTIRLVLSGVYEDFLWELRETLKTYEGKEIITFQPYGIIVTKDMLRYVEGKESKHINYKITRGLTWDDYRIDHDYMTDFMKEIEYAIERLPEKYKDGTID